MTTPAPRVPGMAAFAALNFANAAMMRVCDPMLPALSREFGVTTGQAALTVSSYAITYGVMQLFFGPMGDRWGKRRVAGIAALAAVPGNLLAIAASGLDLLVAARVLAAMAGAGIIPLVLAWIGDTVPYEHRQKILARFLSASVLGMIAGQWVSGTLTQLFGWRTVFATLALVYFCAGFAIVRDPSINGDAIATATQNYLARIRGVLALQWARWVLLMGMLEGACAFAGLTFLASFLVNDFGLSVAASAAIVALYGLGGLVYSFSAATLLRRFGEAGLVAWGAGLLSAAWLAMACAPWWWVAIPAALVAGLGFYAFHNVMQVHATQMAPEARGTSVAFYASCLFFGIASGVWLAAQVVDRAGYRPMFAGCGVCLAVLGALFCRSLRRRTSP